MSNKKGTAFRPSNSDKQEMAGRTHQNADILMAIESGRFSSLDELKATLQSEATLMQALIKCDDVWFADKNSCIDINHSLALQKQADEAKKSSVAFDLGTFLGDINASIK